VLVFGKRAFAALVLVVVAGTAVAAPNSGPSVGNGAEISRSRGRPEGVVVLWPRIVPATSDPAILAVAAKLQGRLEEVAAEAVEPSRVDVRPAPERTCPAAGCRATSLGLMLGHRDGGCAVLAVVGSPEGGVQRMVPLAGTFQMTDAALPFRDPPENDVVVTEFVPCTEVDQRLDVLATAKLLERSPGSAPLPR
jgi:hypothetical protein